MVQPNQKWNLRLAWFSLDYEDNMEFGLCSTLGFKYLSSTLAPTYSHVYILCMDLIKCELFAHDFKKNLLLAPTPTTMPISKTYLCPQVEWVSN